MEISNGSTKNAISGILYLLICIILEISKINIIDQNVASFDEFFSGEVFTKISIISNTNAAKFVYYLGCAIVKIDLHRDLCKI